MAASFDFDWPSVVARLINMQSSLSNVGRSILSIDCFLDASGTTIPAFYVKCIMFLALPVMILVVISIMFVPIVCCIRSKKKVYVVNSATGQKFEQKRAGLKDKFITAVVWCMMYDVWCMYCVWCMMYDVWCMMHVLCMMYDVWCMMYDVWLHDVWLYDVWCLMYDVWCYDVWCMNVGCRHVLSAPFDHTTNLLDV